MFIAPIRTSLEFATIFQQLIVMEKDEPKHEDAASKNCVDESKIKLSLENDKGVDKNDDRSRMLVRTSKRVCLDIFGKF